MFLSPTRCLRSLFLLLLLSLFCPPAADAQVVVHATTGYAVHIAVVPIALVIHTNPCTWGYNYDVELAYSISFTGSNAPSQLYTLQGTVGCGPSSLFFDLPNGPSSGTVTSTGNAWRGVSDCATATLATLGCHAVHVQLHGPGISNRTVSVPFTMLPITLVDLAAKSTAAGMEVAWSTASEQDNAFFTVERSADAVAYTAVAQLPGAGNSTQLLRYSAIDPFPLPGLSYYRLRQTDINGSTSVSHAVVARAAEPRSDSFQVYPNPGASPSVMLPSRFLGGMAEVRTLTGRTVHAGVLEAPALHLPGLVCGTYLITVADPASGTLHHCRYVRQ